jgi:hypothetical protein
MFVGTVRRRRRCHSAPRASSLLRRARPFFYSHQTRSANHASCPLVYSSHDILVRLVVACARAARAHGIQKAARWLLPRILKLYSHKQLLLLQFIYYSQAWMRSHKHCTTQRLGCVHATKQCHRPAPARPPTLAGLVMMTFPPIHSLIGSRYRVGRPVMLILIPRVFLSSSLHSLIMLIRISPSTV